MSDTPTAPEGIAIYMLGDRVVAGEPGSPHFASGTVMKFIDRDYDETVFVWKDGRPYDPTLGYSSAIWRRNPDRTPNPEHAEELTKHRVKHLESDVQHLRSVAKHLESEVQRLRRENDLLKAERDEALAERASLRDVFNAQSAAIAVAALAVSAGA